MRGVKVRDPIERAMRNAFANQRSSAKRRGILFLFTFEQWRDWWQREWHLRGRNYKQFVMGRRNDAGPYSPGNVICISQSQNTLDVFRRHPPKTRGGGKPHLHMRGAAHPRSKRVHTPAGDFESAALAADAFEISPRYAQKMASEHLEGWHYI